MMTDIKEKLELALDFVLEEDYSVTVALAQFNVEDNKPTFRKLSISKEVGDEFVSYVAKRAERLRKGLNDGDLRVLKFSSGYKPDSHEIECLDQQSFKDIVNLVRSVPKAVTIPIHGNDPEFVSELRFYALILDSGKKRLVLFRRFGRNKELTQSNKLLVRFFKERYDLLHEPTFQFDDIFDAFLFSETVFVLRKNDFQHIFRFQYLLLPAAKKTIREIKRVVPIENFDEFQSSCLGHQQKMEKLRNIAKKPYFKKLTIGHLKNTIKHFELNIRTNVGSDNIERIVFDKKDRWAILSLLDDAYLHSQMTGIGYEVNSKRQIKSQKSGKKK